MLQTQIMFNLFTKKMKSKVHIWSNLTPRIPNSCFCSCSTLLVTKKMDFWISGFFYFSVTKRATGDLLMSKRPDFQELFRFLRRSWRGKNDKVKRRKGPLTKSRGLDSGGPLHFYFPTLGLKIIPASMPEDKKWCKRTRKLLFQMLSICIYFFE